MSIEREVFPHVSADDKLYAYTLGGYWMDVGQPKDYLKGICQAVDRCCLLDVQSFTTLVASFILNHEPGLSPGLHLHLDSMSIYQTHLLAKGNSFKGNVLVDPSARIGEGCLIGPDVSIGSGCIIEDGVRLSNCVIMRGVHVKMHSKVCG
jgi:mannose-1-phosphate guanylyltransferase